MCCTQLTENTGSKNYTKNCHPHTIEQRYRATSSQLRHVSTIGKSMLNSNISTCFHNIANFSGVWRTPANFNGFRVLALLLRRRRSTEANKTLHDLWPSPGMVHYIYIFEALAPWQNFASFKIHFGSKSCILLYWQHDCTALEQWPSAKLYGVVQGMELWNFRRGRHLCSAGWPSRWASAHILVHYIFSRSLALPGGNKRGSLHLIFCSGSALLHRTLLCQKSATLSSLMLLRFGFLYILQTKISISFTTVGGIL